LTVEKKTQKKMTESGRERDAAAAKKGPKARR